MRPNLRYTEDRDDPFQRWCDEQAREDLHPMAGDAVVFYSHIPHQGAKFGVDAEGQMRANIVLHYQQNPMFPGINFVSDSQFTLDTLGYRWHLSVCGVATQMSSPVTTERPWVAVEPDIPTVLARFADSSHALAEAQVPAFVLRGVINTSYTAS